MESEDYFSNPFLPGGELSREADVLVQQCRFSHGKFHLSPTVIDEDVFEPETIPSEEMLDSQLEIDEMYAEKTDLPMENSVAHKGIVEEVSAIIVSVPSEKMLDIQLEIDEMYAEETDSPMENGVSHEGIVEEVSAIIEIVPSEEMQDRQLENDEMYAEKTDSPMQNGVAHEEIVQEISPITETTLAELVPDENNTDDIEIQTDSLSLNSQPEEMNTCQVVLESTVHEQMNDLPLVSETHLEPADSSVHKEDSLHQEANGVEQEQEHCQSQDGDVLEVSVSPVEIGEKNIEEVAECNDLNMEESTSICQPTSENLAADVSHVPNGTSKSKEPLRKRRKCSIL